MQNGTAIINQSNQDAQRWPVANTRDRRQSPRWEPSESAVAILHSNDADWSGRVLNLSEGGSEIIGLPSARSALGSDLTIKIEFGTHSVEWSGTLTMCRRRTSSSSHVVTFNNALSIPEMQYECRCCRDIVILLGQIIYDSQEGFMCASCEDRAKEQLGVDYDYQELGWG